MDKKSAKQVVASVGNVFDVDFVISKSTEKDVRQALEPFKAQGATVSETRKENTTWYSVICSYDGGEDTWAMTFTWDAKDVLMSKEKKMLHLGL